MFNRQASKLEGMKSMAENQSFRFELDHEQKLLRITFEGLWTVEAAERYRQARATALESAVSRGISSRDLVILVDRRSQSAQAQDVAATIARVIANNKAIARKTAILVSSAMLRHQVDRTAPGENVRSFKDETEALAWLRQ